MNKKIFAILVALLFLVLLTGCAADASAVELSDSEIATSEKEQELTAESVESDVVVEETKEPTLTSTPTEAPTYTPTLEPTYTPTPTSTPMKDCGDRYWTPDEIVALIWDVDSVWLQFLWDPDLPYEEDSEVPPFPFDFAWFLSPPEGTTREDLDAILAEYAEKLSLVGADCICDTWYTWVVQGYGWPKAPSAEERFGFEFMSNQVYYSVIADPEQEPYCKEFDPDNKEETLLLINNPSLLEDWLQEKETP